MFWNSRRGLNPDNNFYYKLNFNWLVFMKNLKDNIVLCLNWVQGHILHLYFAVGWISSFNIFLFFWVNLCVDVFKLKPFEIFQWSSMNVGFWTEIFQFFWDRNFDEQSIALRNIDFLVFVFVEFNKIFSTGSILTYFACHSLSVLWVYCHQVGLSYLMIWV